MFQQAFEPAARISLLADNQTMPTGGHPSNGTGPYDGSALPIPLWGGALSHVLMLNQLARTDARGILQAHIA